jgi:hypothetical protein
MRFEIAEEIARVAEQLVLGIARDFHELVESDRILLGERLERKHHDTDERGGHFFTGSEHYTGLHELSHFSRWKFAITEIHFTRNVNKSQGKIKKRNSISFFPNFYQIVVKKTAKLNVSTEPSMKKPSPEYSLPETHWKPCNTSSISFSITIITAKNTED